MEIVFNRAAVLSMLQRTRFTFTLNSQFHKPPNLPIYLPSYILQLQLMHKQKSLLRNHLALQFYLPLQFKFIFIRAFSNEFPRNVWKFHVTVGNLSTENYNF